MKHTIAMIVENKPGVFVRIAGMFVARGFSLESISVGPTDDPTVSRLTIQTSGDDRVIEQVNKQLNKLIDVIKVVDITYDDFVERELALVKVKVEPAHRAEIIELANIFRANVIDISPKTLTIEVTGKSDKVEAMMGMLKHFGIQEIARTGAVALKREYLRNSK